MPVRKSYKCPVCGLHYASQSMARKCASWCRRYKSCNTVIAGQSLEKRSQS